jgi:hypothetical protein
MGLFVPPPTPRGRIYFQTGLLVGRPTRARKLNPPDRPFRVQWPLELHERRRSFLGQDPCVVVVWHSTEEGGEELTPGPRTGFQHKMGRSLDEVADEHLW